MYVCMYVYIYMYIYMYIYSIYIEKDRQMLKTGKYETVNAKLS